MQRKKIITGDHDGNESTTTTSPIDSSEDERDLDCSTPINGILPSSAMRRAGFTGLLDMII